MNLEVHREPGTVWSLWKFKPTWVDWLDQEPASLNQQPCFAMHWFDQEPGTGPSLLGANCAHTNFPPFTIRACCQIISTVERVLKRRYACWFYSGIIKRWTGDLVTWLGSCVVRYSNLTSLQLFRNIELENSKLEGFSDKNKPILGVPLPLVFKPSRRYRERICYPTNKY